MSAHRIVFVEAKRVDRVLNIRHHVTAMEQTFDAILDPWTIASEIAQVAPPRP